MTTPRRAEPAPLPTSARAVAALLAAAPAVVVVTGPAGAGRSTLVAELARLPFEGGRPVLVGRCADDGAGAFPLGAVVEALAGAGPLLPGASALAAVTGVLRGLLPELADRLPPAPPDLPDLPNLPDLPGVPELPDLPEPSGASPAGGASHREFRALCALIEVVRPVLVLEDVHAADPLTVRFLRHLVARMPGRASLVLTARSSAAAGPLLDRVLAAAAPEVAVTELELAPLDAGEVAALARRLLGTDGVSPAFAAEVRRRKIGRAHV